MAVPPLRVLQIVASSVPGGGEEACLTLARALRREDVHSAIACDDVGSMADRYAEVATSLDALPLAYPTHLRSIAALRRIIRASHVDLVHTHLWNADLLGGIAARLEGVALVATVHGSYFLPMHPRAMTRARRRVLSLGFRSVYRLCDRVITPSRAVADDVANRPGLRVPRARIDVIHNGLDCDVLDARAAGAPVPVAGPRPALRVAVVANLFPVKGQDVLLEALPAVVARMPDLQVVFVGEGPDRPALEGLTRTLGLARHVVFTGSLPNALGVIRDADLVVVPSRSEALGIVLLEAMALGRPVLATRVGGIPEVIDDGRTGVLVAPEDPAALAQAMLTLLADPVRRAQLGEAAAMEVRREWTASAMAASIAQVYRQVLLAREVAGR